MFIYLKNQKVELPDNSSGKDLAKKLSLDKPNEALAMKVGDSFCDLSNVLKNGDKVEMISFEQPIGKEIFWHTSAHVLAQAVMRLYPDAKATIGPPIENGFYYDFANLKISDSDFAKIEEEAKKIIKENFEPVREEFSSKAAAKKAFADNKYKLELIDSFEGTISAYRQGEYHDLCRGPHLPKLSKIKAFKILKVSGAYWKGDQKNEMLTRIYGISFPDREQLDNYLKMIEEAKKRDHKLLGQELDLFSLKDEAPGMPFIHAKGMIIWNNLLTYVRGLLFKAGYIEIKTPILLTKDLWEKSGHWQHYRQNMFTLKDEEREFAIKPMNCPGSMLWYKSTIHSYRELPLRVAEIGLVHRKEKSGALNGLFRVQSFHQDDAHIYMRKENIKDEIFGIIKLIDEAYMTLGMSYKLELSTRPEKSKTVGSDEDWELATQSLKQALEEWGKPYKINEGDGAFYGPKIDVHICDALGRYWQCATIQLDMSMPERFGLEFVDNDGEHKRPVMVHRTLLGSIERFLGILIEHFCGKFPLWLSPLGVRILPVADRHNEYAKKIENEIKAIGVNCDSDLSCESLGKKVRNAQLLKINYMLTVGDKEVENKTISIRTRDNYVHGEAKLSHFLEKIKDEKERRSLISPFDIKGEKQGVSYSNK